ncbi:Zinc finger and SCAN domain-containing protein 4 [Myotis brandtii]|uniref:Zinc finger and SCAN domain-containing protein 4 n=1 Tax=Myotis brandtii TaxID=109478 RepID=S7NR93_MYOBR|nr:Zinc finger and SCAN domain-containing protein 4 [Myotis brandtii]
MEQFLLNRPSSQRAAWQEKWESSGRDMEAFMEDLGDEGLRPPSLVHVSMEGQEALFSENMPLGQVLAHFQEQRSAAAPMALTPGTPFRTPPETPRTTAPGDADEDGDNLSSPDPPPPPCSSCRERALRARGERGASDLRVHQLIHAEERPFRCDRAFSHRTNLLAHERIHMGAKPYACAQCGRTYRQSSTYHRHLRMHQRKASTPGASMH